MYNLLRLCELLVGRCRNLKTIQLLTGRETSGDNNHRQDEMLGELKKSLAKNNVSLIIEFSTSLHDREIRSIIFILLISFIIANFDLRIH